jgi:hypothetical protein
MPKQIRPTLAFNRGVISLMGLARVDLERSALSAEIQRNFMPRLLGSMSLRPGLEYIGETNNDEQAKTMDIVYGPGIAAQLEFTDETLRVRVDDELVTRPAVTAAITNGTFTTNVTGWTDGDESGSLSQWRTGGYLALFGSGNTAAIRTQQVTCNEPGTEHALRIVVARGPVILRVGSTATGDDYISETTLGTGTHSLAFTPTGDFHVRLMNRRNFTSLVDSVAIEAAGVMELPTRWETSDFPLLRSFQSNDIIFVACRGKQQGQIERRGQHSWSVVLYETETGPFRTLNTSPITLTPSALFGDITLTASSPFFKSTNVGSLFRIASNGQSVLEAIGAEDTFTDPIRVSGVGAQRAFLVTIAGSFTATATLQYSVGEPDNWIDADSWTTAVSESYNDGLDNQIVYYRIGVKAGDFSSGPVSVSLTYTAGSIIGVCRVTGFTNSTTVSAIVLQDFGATTASSYWWESQWSDRRGWPTAGVIHESRWGWADDYVNLSITDQPYDFDDEFEGDAGPISRSIGEGPAEAVTWMLSLARLAIGTMSSSADIEALRIQGANPISARSSSFDEPLTPTNYNMKNAAATGMFVDTSLTRLMHLIFNVDVGDYVPQDMCVACPDFNRAGIVGIAVQYKPDMRVHCWRADGTVAVMVRDRAENLICWVDLETDGFVENVSVKPDAEEDRVYYTVRRTIGSSTKRFIERFALESQCTGFPEARLADSHVIYEGAETTTITGLGHLEGMTVVCWGWNTTTPFVNDDGEEIGRDFGTFTVSGGQITGLSAAVTNACVGLGYTARFKSGKQAFAAATGSALNGKKKIDHLGLILLNTHCQGISFGPDFDHLDPLPLVEDGGDVGTHHIWDYYDKPLHPFDGTWTTDARFCLEASAPRPCTVSCATVQMTTHQ